MMLQGGLDSPVYKSGIRELHVNKKLVNLWATRTNVTTLEHIARFRESFITNDEIWLVFRHEGKSLYSMMYSGNSNNEGLQLMQPTDWWLWMKTTHEGQKEMQIIIYQILLGLQACHNQNITHRDIKPHNILVRGTSMVSEH